MSDQPEPTDAISTIESARLRALAASDEALRADRDPGMAMLESMASGLRPYGAFGIFEVEDAWNAADQAVQDASKQGAETEGVWVRTMAEHLGIDEGDEEAVELTAEEAKAIRSLQRLAKTWPRSLTLASMGGGLFVVRTGDPRLADDDGSHDRQEAILADIKGIPNTGGDW